MPWATTIFKNFLIVPLKATILKQISIQYIYRYLSFALHYDGGGKPQISVKSLWQAADH
jgi:hypothetical protein